MLKYKRIFYFAKARNAKARIFLNRKRENFKKQKLV